MKRFAGLIALVGILGVGSWLALRGNEPRGRAASTAAASAGAQASPTIVDAPAVSPASPLAPAPVAAEPATVPSARTAVATPYEEELARAIWVEGRVLFPQGTPADEKATVVALGKKFEHGERHRAEVATDGRFRVAFSEKTKSGQLALEARYLYLSEVGRWKASDADAPVTLEPVLGGRIEGKLVLPAGARADTGGKVQLHGFRREDVDEREPVGVAADLSFAFGCLDPHQEYSVSYDGATFVGSSPRFSIEPGGTHATEILLRPGVVLAGHVRDEAGLPISGFSLEANVQIQSGDSASTWRSTSSAEDGSFRFAALSPGKIELQGSKQGFTRVERKLGRLAEGERPEDLELVLTRGNAIAGRVQWPDGTPAEKAWVSVTEERGEPGYAATTQQSTSADGSFQISGLGEGPFSVSAGGVHAEEVMVKSELTGRERKKKQRENWRDERERVSAGTSDLVLTLSSGLTVSGRVVDERGANVDDFTVGAQRSGRNSGWVEGIAPLSKSFRDAGGAFTLSGLSPGSWELSATAKGYADSKPVTLDVPSTAPLELVVAHAVLLRGLVLDPHGAPVAGAQLLQEQDDLSWSPDNSQSNERGAFTIERVPPGTVTLTARATGYAPSDPLRLELEAGEVRDGLVLNLRIGGTVTGEVIGPGARPEIEQNVILDSEAYSASTETDAQGHFVLTGVPAGEYSIQSDTSGGLQLHAKITLAEGEGRNVRLAPSDGALVRLHGHVTIGGKVVDGIHLFAHRQQDGEQAQSSSTECDSDGAYELTVPGAGRYRLSLGRFDGGDLFSWNTSIDVPGVAEFTCDLAVPAGRVRGRVTGRDGGSIADVLVRSQHEVGAERMGADAQTQTDSDGRYELLVVAGPLTVVAGGKNWSSSEGGVSWGEARVSGLSVAANQELAGIDFVLSAGGTLVGRVRRADGDPIVHARVFRCEGSEHDMIGSTGRDGTFRITGLELGTLLVGATSDRAATLRPLSVTIESGRTTEIELELVPAVFAHVLVHDAAGASIPCDITALDGEGRPCPVTRTRTDGEAGLGPLVAGRYTVRAERDGKRVERAFEVRGDEEKLEVELTLE